MSTLLTRALSRGAMLAAGATALRATVAAAAGSRNGQQTALLSERDKVAHLLRRAGFGYSQAELDEYAKLGVNGAVDRLLAYDQVADTALDQRLEQAKLNLYNTGDLQRWWLLRMLYTRRPLQEKMTLFWHGLLVSGTGKVGIQQPKADAPPDAPKPLHHMLNQNVFFRENALADFGRLLKGISRDPAMVIYLDSNQNRKGKPNENYARELMELFTLGIAGPDGSPNYSEQDVREAARAFTGWGLNREQEFAYNAGQHDGGQKTIFGKTGPFNGDDVIGLILQHPSCAYYLSRRMWQFFAYDAPTLETLRPVMDAFKATNGSASAMLRAIFTHSAFYSELAYRAVPKSPVEYLASFGRALELDTNATGFQSSAQRMAQTLFNPPNVAGWPGGAQWFNSTTWLERLNQLNRVITIRKDTNTQPVDLFGMLQRSSLDSPEKVVDHFLKLLVDGQVRPEQRQTLIDYVKEGNLWPKPGVQLKASDAIVDRKVRGVVYLIAAMPEFHLA
ncbi:MAG: PROBABLE SIGNAL PEPTIDE PROTEIN [uncultured Chloroflexi bacterium]|uniref:PROBABLE SIGNAL PEPTIDE PROTEIN n=1 Tax=uncultured Chloroflexota bacterium TaxID=166587 RepID=A0A6J4KFX4_9CHLR|nr:MAG: PROBABLE SIGNAL PEPTIDE PROTEIN [uncultured Chloroflexota bacterium]